MEVDPGLTQVRAVAFALSLLLPPGSEDLQKLGRAACLYDALGTSASSGVSAPILGSIADCIGNEIGGGKAQLLKVVTAGVPALWSEVEGLLRTALGLDEFSFQIASTAEFAPDGSPINRASVEPMLGTWVGPVDQPGSRDYSVRLTLTHDGRSVVGVVEYPELRCSGYLHNASLASDGVLRIQETITRNGSCVTDVGLELGIQGDRLSYYFGRRTDQNSEGTGLLTRE